MEKVEKSVWDSKDRALDAQSAIKSATNVYQATGKGKETLELAEKFYDFIKSKRSIEVNNVELPD